METKYTNKKQKGQGMVEFSLVFPLLLILVFGVFEFGRMMFSYSAAIAASREAARYGAAIQDIGGIPQYEDCSGIREAAKRIGKFAGIEDSDITIQYSNEYGVYSTSCPPAQEIGLADKIAVTVNAELTPFSPVGNFSPIPIRSSANRTILKNVKMGSTGTGAGSISGALTDVNFKTTAQRAEETAGVITVDLILNQASTNDVSVPLQLTGTALEGQDYTLAANPVVIPAGLTTATVSINLVNDGIEEGDESIIIGLGTPTNATKGPQDIHTVILADPPQVEFSVASSTKSESMNTVGIMLELSKGSNQDVTVPISSSGTADWGEYQDYTYSPTSVVIPSGSLSGMVTVTIKDDQIDENDEHVYLDLETPTNGLLGDQTRHTLTIEDNDSPPQVAFNSSSQVVSEEIGVYYTTITLSEVSGKEIAVPFTTSGTVTADDFTLNTPSPLTIPAGSKSVDIEILISEGDGWEEDEILTLTLQDSDNADLGSPSSQDIVITEGTPEPTVYFTDTSTRVIEGNIYLHVGVDLSNAWFEDIEVNYSLSGTAQAGSGSDYLIDPSPLTIASGRSHEDILVQINEDQINEADETIIIDLVSAVESSGTLTFSLSSPTTHTVTIEDDDAPPEVAFQLSSQNVLETGGSVSVQVNLSHGSADDVRVPLAYSGTATQDADYTANTVEVVIPAGTLSQTFSVGILDDAVYDPDEFVQISMGTPTNAVLGDLTQHKIYIEDDEITPCDVGTYLYSVGTDSLTWSLVNDGETVTFTGGTITWPDPATGKPRLNTIMFDGSEVYSGNESPGTLNFSASQSFQSLATGDLFIQFAKELSSGNHSLSVNFEHSATGTSCTESVEIPVP
ncbi:MAG: Calx-beta domain-containing protein [Anaerolineales bacterium]|nr:Calx-beta domain-containing protein [Anaerolineales bacterium]